ncbi:hypothetical protein GGS20DRAFT_583736 [Poronia punctata]|nr:hypothetical protein GGS20DRAFT_583736 [Poronia punctata]
MAVSEAVQQFPFPKGIVPTERDESRRNPTNMELRRTRVARVSSSTPQMWDFRYRVPILAHNTPSSQETTSEVDSPMSMRLPSPVSAKGEVTFKPACVVPGSFGQPPIWPLEREYEDRRSDADGSISLPGFRSLLLPYDDHFSHSPEPTPLLTPSTSPEPSEADFGSRRPSLFMAQDPITEKLNYLRVVENKGPLPPLQGLRQTGPYGYNGESPHGDSYHREHSRQLVPARENRKRRAKPKDHPHCNIKYMVEELDYIRYQRVDFAQEWDIVETKFHEKFPMVVFPEERQKQGLQGVIYRQNNVLPRLIDGRLVFMENGHVEPVCIKTREQTEERHLYTLVNLFPERAMLYEWVQPKDRQRAAELSHDRRIQMEQARLDAIARGTYLETLPPPQRCGCCPGEDRPRQKKRRLNYAMKKANGRAMMTMTMANPANAAYPFAFRSKL